MLSNSEQEQFFVAVLLQLRCSSSAVHPLSNSKQFLMHPWRLELGNLRLRRQPSGMQRSLQHWRPVVVCDDRQVGCSVRAILSIFPHFFAYSINR